jgi:hypothetical protein
MKNRDPINSLELEEFRLYDAGTAPEAARIVATFVSGREPAVPLLTSIDDDRDVAIIRGVHAGEREGSDPRQRAALEPLVASWQPVRRYGPRITERSESPPTYYRLAVTESGITSQPEAPASLPRAGPANTAKRVGLLWIGSPVDTYAGLLTLLGTDDGAARRAEPREWLPLSRSLGVRIYESQR